MKKDKFISFDGTNQTFAEIIDSNLTIYDVYVKMKDQAQCDRMKQVCIDYGLDYWDDFEPYDNTFGCFFIGLIIFVIGKNR